MAYIKMNGKEYELKFTYLSLLAIEKHFKKGVFKVFSEADLNSLETITVFIWACLKKEKDFKNKTADDIAFILDDAIENEETTLEEVAEALQEGFTNSTILKKAVQEQQAKQDEGEDGEQEGEEKK